MHPERAKRKIGVNLSADVKDHSRLMSQDEVATVRTIKQYRQLIKDLITE